MKNYTLQAAYYIHKSFLILKREIFLKKKCMILEYSESQRRKLRPKILLRYYSVFYIKFLLSVSKNTYKTVNFVFFLHKNIFSVCHWFHIKNFNFWEVNALFNFPHHFYCNKCAGWAQDYDNVDFTLLIPS